MNEPKKAMSLEEFSAHCRVLAEHARSAVDGAAHGDPATLFEVTLNGLTEAFHNGQVGVLGMTRIAEEDDLGARTEKEKAVAEVLRFTLKHIAALLDDEDVRRPRRDGGES